MLFSIMTSVTPVIRTYVTLSEFKLSGGGDGLVNDECYGAED